MNAFRRTAAAAAAAFALTSVAGAAQAAPPAGPPADDDRPGKSQVKQLLKDISVKNNRLNRIEGSHKLARLFVEHQATVVGNIDADQLDLATLAEQVNAADSTVDIRAARRELRDFRVENYTLAITIIRSAEQLVDDVAEDAEAQVELDEAFAAALAITADSTKADVRAARTALNEVYAEIEDVEEPVEPEEPTEPEV